MTDTAVKIGQTRYDGGDAYKVVGVNAKWVWLKRVGARSGRPRRAPKKQVIGWRLG